MKRTRTISSTADREAVIDRDGSEQCILCGGRGQDFDHAIRLSAALPHLNEAWNLNVLCRICHMHVTNPDTREKWLKALKVIQIALHRAYEVFPEHEVGVYYQYYKSKRGRFEQIYGKD